MLYFTEMVICLCFIRYRRNLEEHPLKYVKYFNLIIKFLNFALKLPFDKFEIGNLSVETILLT